MSGYKKIKGINVINLSLIMAAAIMLQACVNDAEPEGPVEIKVWAYDGQFNQFAELVREKFPHVDIKRVQPYQEVIGLTTEITDVDAYYEGMIGEIEKTQPDILVLWEEERIPLIEANRLQPLDLYIQRESFESETYPASLIDFLRMDGNGQLYAITDTFYIEALYYNKTLLDTYNIPHPHNAISWDEVFELAESVPKADDAGNSLVGYYLGIDEIPRPWLMIWEIGMSAGLEYIQPDANKVVIDTPTWRAIWESVLASYESGALIQNVASKPELTEQFVNGVAIKRKSNTYPPFQEHQPFLEGRAALYRENLTFSFILEQFNVPFEWGLVTEPVNANLGGGITLRPGVGYSISDYTVNDETAWSIVEYLTGMERAMSMPPVNPLGGYLPARKVSTVEDYSALYDLQLSPSNKYLLNPQPPGFASEFEILANEKFILVLEGEQTLEQALKDLQSEAQILLDSMEE